LVYIKIVYTLSGFCLSCHKIIIPYF
jgi:hypothetical protein